MKTYRQLQFHVVFATKGREPSLRREIREELYRYIWGICKNLECTLNRIGGTENHIHMLFEINPSLSLVDFMRTVKTNSSRWLRSEKKCANFQKWQEGYAAFSVSYSQKTKLIEYIKNQEEHHRKISFLDEYRVLLKEAGIMIDERYLP